MPPPRDSDPSNESDGPGGPGRNQPLVIVSERGRHSEASRRIVRAQAARASAAQSRETRARNREDRHQRDGTQAPAAGSHSNLQQSAYVPPDQKSNASAHNIPALSSDRDSDRRQDEDQRTSQQSGESPLKPLMDWVTNVLHLSASTFAAGAAILASSGRPQLANASEVLSRAGGYLADNGSAMEAIQVIGGPLSRKLPIALPKGFASLQQRIQISDSFLVLISRTACFDFASPGVENRLHELLFEIVSTSAMATMTDTDQPGHPIQSHLRIACICLTIFQGQRADGQSFARDQKYATGLERAWAEAIVLDQAALQEPKSAEAALWSCFIISVTCGSTVDFFRQLLSSLIQDLQLRYWEQVRNVLLEFIYPGSFLDEPCRRFYEDLQVPVAGHDQAVNG